jgi:50S ribosomal subunit-associated GTPase HflX
VGSGKADEIKALAEQTGATEVLFDQSLSPAQQRNLERHISLPVNDRTLLILEIFAQRARSHEGKLQVELARCSTSARAWCAAGPTWSARPAAQVCAAARAKSRSNWTAG